MQKLRSPIFWLSIAGILAVYAALGFLAVPRILTGVARDTVKADFGRELAIGDLRFNPFTLTLEVDKLSLPDTDGSPLLAFDRLLVDFAEQRGAQAIVRGLRAVSDFEFEFQLALMNRNMNEREETIFMMPKDTYTYLSSRMIKEIARLGGDVAAFVPPQIKTALETKYFGAR